MESEFPHGAQARRSNARRIGFIFEEGIRVAAKAAARE
jgi:hypothetical protein